MVHILAVGAHPDDIELGFGGSIARFVEEGFSVALLDLTNGEPTPKGDPVTRAKECAQATEILGVKTRITLDLPNRTLTDTVEARVKVAEVYRELRPEMIFLHGETDAHPDHMAAWQIAHKARFHAKLTKTDMKGEPWYPKKEFLFLASHLNLQVDPAFILDVSSTFEKKLEAARAYKSQFAANGREEFLIEKLTAHASHYGSLIGVKYGEPVMLKEPLGLASVRDIIL
ncbi:MAG: bacillithiol biosynthesis deacetylase BshB1 [Nitrospinae bacterium]|nr:bacillithiol biosynthesis deacetylase BshB1 [Nitrospinota bacterium]